MPTPPKILILALALFIVLLSSPALASDFVNGALDGNINNWLGGQAYYQSGMLEIQSTDWNSWSVQSVYQDVDFTGAETFQFDLVRTDNKHTQHTYDDYFRAKIDDVVVHEVLADSYTWSQPSIDLTGMGLTGVHRVTFTTRYMLASMDNIMLIAPAPDYNSTSTGHLELYYDTSTFVNEPGTIQLSVLHADNSNFDYHTYYIEDESGYSLTLSDSESVFDFLVNFVESSPTTKTYDLYESYAYYDANLGYSIVENNILDTLTFDIVTRPASTKSEIWTNDQLLANETIQFYYDIENYNLTTYDYYVSVVSSSQNPDSFRDQVFTRSGSFSKELLPGSYTAWLEKEISGLYYTLDAYNFYIPETTPGNETDIIEVPETPEVPELPELPEIPDIPEENGTLENNETGQYNSTFLSGYYQSVDDIGNFFFQPLESGFEFLVYPVNALNGSVNSAVVLVQSSGADMQGYTPIVASIFVPLIAALPPKVQGLITYNLTWMLIIMIFRRK